MHCTVLLMMEKMAQNLRGTKAKPFLLSCLLMVFSVLDSEQFIVFKKQKSRTNRNMYQIELVKLYLQ